MLMMLSRPLDAPIERKVIFQVTSGCVPTLGLLICREWYLLLPCKAPNQAHGLINKQKTLLWWINKHMSKLVIEGAPGHLVSDCSASATAFVLASVPTGRPPGLCPHCGWRKHWANECKSKYTADRFEILGIGSQGEPCPHQMVGAMSLYQSWILPPHQPLEYPSCPGLPKKAEDWTSDPPPTSY